MEATEFVDLLRSGKMTRCHAKKAMAAYGIGTVTVPSLAGHAMAEGDDQPVFLPLGRS